MHLVVPLSEFEHMCVHPQVQYVEKGGATVRFEVGCRVCWQCRSNRVSDYVGRCLCEASSSDWVVTLTLTYRRRTDFADVVLVPRHFQEFVRSMRKRGHKLRYIAVGEYGTLKARPHFHCILFGKGKPPEIAQQKREHLGAWPHGHVFADWNCDERSIRYICKYLLKEDHDDHWFSISKKPALGSEWFSKKADEHIRLKSFPSSFNYLPPGGHKGRQYLMQGAVRRDFVLRLVNNWPMECPIQMDRLSKWTAGVVDKVTLDDLKKFASERFYALANAEQIALLGEHFDRSRTRKTERQFVREHADEIVQIEEQERESQEQEDRQAWGPADNACTCADCLKAGPQAATKGGYQTG